jgi:hypothetical protein
MDEKTEFEPFVCAGDVKTPPPPPAPTVTV